MFLFVCLFVLIYLSFFVKMVAFKMCCLIFLTKVGPTTKTFGKAEIMRENSKIRNG